MNFLDMVSSWKEKGILLLVAEETSFERRIEGETLPSVLAQKKDGEKESIDPVRLLLFQEYFLIFSCG